ncbi:MAG: sulfotransferase [Spirochaetes bacterium]|nr:sulfotransferase [Spirochaetota bacterium]
MQKPGKKQKKTFIKMLIPAGNTFPNWIRVLKENRFYVSFPYLFRAFQVTFITLILYPLVLIERLLYNHKIKKTQMDPPVFILGHMRSGTTFLHYLLCQDPQFCYPTTLETTFPSIFLTFRGLTQWIMNFAVPEKRPMDNMGISSELPNEEELGMANLTPYSPNNGAYFTRHYLEFLKKYALFEDVSNKVIDSWKKTYLYFLKKIVFKNNDKIFVSKNLPNFGRIKQLLELFPESKFIFIYRNPYKVYHSTMKLFKKFIIPHMGFHTISDEELSEQILQVAKTGFKTYFKNRNLIPAKNLIEIKFEDFVQTPVEHMEKIYGQLNIDGLETAKPYFVDFCKDYANYKPDQYQMDPVLKERIYTEWKDLFQYFGYEK